MSALCPIHGTIFRQNNWVGFLPFKCVQMIKKLKIIDKSELFLAPLVFLVKFQNERRVKGPHPVQPNVL